ncbi:MAG: YgjV family protein [Clostridia bacterium]|nr:YgjV family protein [Clostridia bacterium]
MGNLSINVIIAQIAGIFAMLVFAIVPQQKSKKRSLIMQIISDIFYGIQYLLLNAFSAVASNVIGAVNKYIFYVFAKKNKNVPIIILFIYIAITIVSGILTFTNILSVFPIFLSILYTYGAWQSNLKIYRIISVVGAALWIIYNFSVGAYIGAIGNVIQLISAIIAVIRLDIIKKEEKINNQENAEILTK